MTTNNTAANKRTPTVFIVYRDDHRVSDRDHVTKDLAQAEVDYWLKILKKYPDGSKMRIVEMPIR